MLKRTVALSLVLLSGWPSTMLGPTGADMPGRDKSLGQFPTGDVLCRHNASGQIYGEAGHASLVQGLWSGGGLLGGVGFSAAFGGAAVRAAAGAIDACTSSYAQDSLRQKYDTAYPACQATRANQVLVLAAGRAS